MIAHSRSDAWMLLGRRVLYFMHSNDVKLPAMAHCELFYLMSWLRALVVSDPNSLTNAHLSVDRPGTFSGGFLAEGAYLDGPGPSIYASRCLVPPIGAGDAEEAWNVDADPPGFCVTRFGYQRCSAWLSFVGPSHHLGPKYVHSCVHLQLQGRGRADER